MERGLEKQSKCAKAKGAVDKTHIHITKSLTEEMQVSCHPKHSREGRSKHRNYAEQSGDSGVVVSSS